MNNKQWSTLAAILSITGLELYAISQGIDGILLAGAIAVIAGLAGYEAGSIVKHVVDKLKPKP
jgi:hypothetical protein